MKILLVNKFHYRKGGSETYYFALAEALRRAGHQVIFFAMDSKKICPVSRRNILSQMWSIMVRKGRRPS